MAILSPNQLVELRQAAAEDQVGINWTKAQINAAAQAVEDWFEANRPSLNAAINTATSPVVLPGAVKRLLLIRFLMQKSRRE